MQKYIGTLLSFLGLICLISTISAQDTFSIVAVDPETGEVGSAGATCLTSADCGGCGGAVIISGLVPGVGGINSQAWVCIPNTNLNKGLTEMQNGKSPQEILDFLIGNDFCASQNNNPAYRQYGIVDLDANNEPRAVSHSGANTDAYSNHITGINYSIQGNILLGQEILDDMEAGFLNTSGTLAEKLMAAMQGANVPGADTRCLVDGISSKSSYLRVAQPDDNPNDFYLDIIVESTETGVDPIDSLQTLFDGWLVTGLDQPILTTNIDVYPNPTSGKVSVEIPEFDNLKSTYFTLHTLDGKEIRSQKLTDKFTTIDLSNENNLTYIYRIHRIVGEVEQLISTGKIVVQK